jgi:hypothetical protein
MAEQYLHIQLNAKVHDKQFEVDEKIISRESTLKPPLLVPFVPSKQYM